jgi:hypothetical protein
MLSSGSESSNSFKLFTLPHSVQKPMTLTPVTRIFWTVVVTVYSLYAGFASAERTPIAVADSLSVESATFAVEELKKLSDSGVYKTLSLKSIVSASTENGTYHFNVFLTLELSSTYFESTKSSEKFDFIVLKSHEDGVLSFAIDEFPLMQESAIEKYWIEMVDEHRRKREKTFFELEEKGLEADAQIAQNELKVLSKHVSLSAEREKYAQMSTESLQVLEKAPTVHEYQRHIIGVELDKRWKEHYRQQQKQFDENLRLSSEL